MGAERPSVSSLIPADAIQFVRMSGSDLADRIGYEELRSIVAGVLCGENIRAATEPLTRRRISSLNAAILVTILRASRHYTAAEINTAARRDFQQLATSDPKRAVLMWVLGLTGKQVQNVLRSDTAAWTEFLAAAAEASSDSARLATDRHGPALLEVTVGQDSARLDWLWAHVLFTAIGSQTLATRGAEKSMYGKFFEKLILGSVLDVLGFEYDASRSGRAMTYWLSDRGEKRESDATAIIQDGEGVRFDIGFIGAGNTEISLDKVSRFERSDEIAGRRFSMSTIIIVDRIGASSRIAEMARGIGGRILQMSSALWAKSLDRELDSAFAAYVRTFADSDDAADIRAKVAERLTEADLGHLLETAS